MLKRPDARVHRVSVYLVCNRDRGSSEPTTANKLDLTGLGGSILIVQYIGTKIIHFCQMKQISAGNFVTLQAETMNHNLKTEYHEIFD